MTDINELRMLSNAEERRMKPLVIYPGGGCTDGFGAAFAAWLKLGDEAEYLPMEYGATYNFDLSGFVVNHAGYEINEREVFILDFSFPREVMEDIFVHAKRVVWIDHHKTAFETWCGGYRKGDRFQAIPLGGADPLKHYIVLDDNFSGAYLAWEYFHPGTEVPMLIQRIDDYDRWQCKLDGSKESNAANPAVINTLRNRLEAAEKERDALRASKLTEGLETDLFIVEHAMRMNKWDWNSDTSDDLKRSAYKIISELRAVQKDKS